MKGKPIIAVWNAIASTESEPLTRRQLSGPAASRTPAFGGICAATASAGACTRILA